MSRVKLPLLNILAAVGGVGLLVFTVQRVGGWTAIVDGIAGIGGWFGAVVALGALRMACRTRAWQAAANEPQLTFGDAFGAWMVADAVGNLTPLGVLASEPTKILMVRSKMSTGASIASVAIENAFYIVSVLVVLLSGTWLFLQRANVPTSLEQISEAIVAGVAIVTVIGIWAIRTRPAVLSTLAPVLSRLVGKSSAPADTMREVEARIFAVPTWPAGRLVRVAVWEIVFHIAAVAEVWLVLRLLVPDITVGAAFLLESTGRFVTVAFKFVPYRLGIDEVGSGAVAAVLGLPPAAGVTLALIRRLRIMVLNAIGLVRLIR